jgi:hypothetical protein
VEDYSLEQTSSSLLTLLVSGSECS